VLACGPFEPGHLREQVRSFYRLFYQVELGDADLDRVLAGAGD